MTEQQTAWMREHPTFKYWKPQGLFSCKGWTDVGWVMRSGTFVADGEHHGWGGVHTMSSGDTLYVMQGSDAIKVAREFDIC